MVLSLCVIGAGATFTDNSKVTADYSEAVGIMTDLAVVKGYPDGSFKPAGTLTRAEACVLMANMTLGTTAAAALAPTTVTFKDVPASYWGYKYVEYCYQCGYIAGTGAGNFAPGATLTGYQWALMLMRILGYDMTSLTTGNWQINTAKVYYAADTQFSKVAISSAAVTREAASQMAYDALFASTNKTTGYPVYLRTYNAAGDNYTDTLIKTYSSLTDAAAATTALNNGAGYTANHLPGASVKYYYYGTETTSSGTGTLAYAVFGVTKNETAADAY
ncbi:MAG TPA: S-layer homology domain-containing protein, partial [Oscillospiraceae bacterium]|nr:S-layer homology domain-containing protein [Oscillospiraceae bacterium]